MSGLLRPDASEDLEVVPGSVDLVTIGEAFHRLDQSLILRRIGQWLKDDACVALVGCYGVMHGEHAWQESLRGALSEWTDEPLDRPPATRGKDHDIRRLIEAGFAGVVNRDCTASHIWSRDGVLGHLHSTSRFSLSALGDSRERFEAAVLGALGSDEASRFPQDVSCGYTIGWKRGSDAASSPSGGT